MEPKGAIRARTRDMGKRIFRALHQRYCVKDERRKGPGAEPCCSYLEPTCAPGGAGTPLEKQARSPRHARTPGDVVCVRHREQPRVAVRSEERGKKRRQERHSRACQGLQGRSPGCAETAGPGSHQPDPPPRERCLAGPATCVPRSARAAARKGAEPGLHSSVLN